MNKLFIVLIFFLACLSCSAEMIQDDFAMESLVDVKTPVVNTKYNYLDTTSIPVKLIVAKRVKSEQDLYEGQTVEFRLVKHIIYKNKIFVRRCTIVPAKVKLIISSGMNGIPASIIFSDFKIDGLTQARLSQDYEISGQDRSWLVFPLKWALTVLPPTGSLTNFIMGGHAKVNYKKQITIYYYPDWK